MSEQFTTHDGKPITASDWFYTALAASRKVEEQEKIIREQDEIIRKMRKFCGEVLEFAHHICKPYDAPEIVEFEDRLEYEFRSPTPTPPATSNK